MKNYVVEIKQIVEVEGKYPSTQMIYSQTFSASDEAAAERIQAVIKAVNKL